MTDAKEAYKLRHLEQGLCTICTEPLLPGSRLCAKHRKYFTIKAREYRKKWLLERKCNRCGKPLDPEIDGNKKSCFICVEVSNANFPARITKGF